MLKISSELLTFERVSIILILFKSRKLPLPYTTKIYFLNIVFIVSYLYNKILIKLTLEMSRSILH